VEVSEGTTCSGSVGTCGKGPHMQNSSTNPFMFLYVTRFLFDLLLNVPYSNFRPKSTDSRVFLWCGF